MKKLQLASIYKRFGAQEVLRDVRLEVASGEFVTLLGPSGCGKTTLLRIIAGLELPDSGSILLGGEDIGALPANRRPVNTVFQNYALFPHLDVFENVAFGLRSRGVAASEIQDRATRAMEMLQLESFARRGIHQLSGGQKQRVALARALVNEPDVLLLDEPLSALDAKLRAEVQLELRRLQRKLGKTFILVTHDQDEAITVSDRIMVMREGKIEQIGAPEEVYERPVNRFVAQFLGAANIIGATRIPGEDRAVQTEFGNLTLAASPAWEKGSLAVRPERIRISVDRPPSNAVRTTVREVVYRGDHVELFLDPGALRVRSLPSAHAGMELKCGAEIWIELPVDRIQILAH